jgi:hypothetical protein
MSALRGVVVLIAASALAGCNLMPFGEPDMARESTTLNPADAATSLIVGGPVVMELATPVDEPPEGQDPLVSMTLTRSDGRGLSFTLANHTPYDVMAQAPGGSLANVMGLFGEEAPLLYARDAGESSEAPFICGPEGPAYLGVYRGEDGAVSIVGLRAGFEFSPLDDGGYTPLPYSPDLVCARMRFTTP